ncbi:MAG: hypothetical protein K9K67_09320 [Bacteriovoracaceae bacterium]|nr:hypothetical protein [Bacteriovoracaceae bacterium]
MSLEKSILTIIYGPYQKAGRIEGQEIMSVFNENGLVDETTLDEEYLEVVNHAPGVLEEGAVGPFNDLEVIQKFSFNLCQKLGNHGASLVSLDDYNELLAASYKVEDLKQKLEEKGSFIKNPEAGKSGIFNKIFN